MSTVSRRETLRILSGCLGGSSVVSRWAGDPVRLAGPPLDGALVVHLAALAMGDGASWGPIVAMRPDLADLDGRDVVAVLDRIFTPGANP